MSNDQAILAALRRIIRAVDLRSRELQRQYGLTGPQLIVLDRVSGAAEGLTISELAAAVELSQPTVTGIVNRLERRLMVSRRRSKDDRRRVLVSLTAAGTEVLASAPPLLQQDFLDRLDGLADWERTQILSTLQRVVSLLDASQIDAAPMLVNGAIGEESPLPQGASAPIHKAG